MTKKLVLFVAAVAMLGALAAACAQAPVIVYIVVTATPEGTQVAQIAPTATTEIIAATSTLEPSPTASSTQQEATADSQVSPVPTVIVRQIYVAEQPFQRGRMFWLEPTGQIWVMVETQPGIGDWQVYEDLFNEGDPETDPGLIPPAGLFQPVRGFGLIWRTGENVRDQIGWASDIEVGFVSNYEYHPGDGSAPGNFVPGYHFMQNQYGDWYRFNEINHTWQTVQRAAPTATPTGDATN